MIRVMQRALIAFAVALCAAWLVMLSPAVLKAATPKSTPFPALRAGTGNQPTKGAAFVGGTRYVPRSAVIAWSRKWSTLTLYLLLSKSPTCGTLQNAVSRPGYLVQVFVTGKPHVTLGRSAADPQVAFVTTYFDPNTPPHVSGLKHGGVLKFTHIDSHPKGVWHGSLSVPKRKYGDGKIYGYNGTFAARWCDVRG